MNTVVTSREAILIESRKIVMEHGISAINMRTVAAACHVAVGSIYNYFPSKADLTSAAVEDVWKDIFQMSNSCFEFTRFTDCLSWLCESIQNGCKKYPGFFTLHSMSFTTNGKEKGRKMMDHYFGHIKEILLNVLLKDPDVRSNAFNDQLTPEAFIDLIFTTAISILLQNQTNCLPLLQMVKNCIY